MRNIDLGAWLKLRVSVVRGACEVQLQESWQLHFDLQLQSASQLQ